MRPYQEKIVQDIISNLKINKPYVLGSCPSSGKTEMAIEVMIRLLESGQINRVLVLAHSTNVLKENFYNRLLNYFDNNLIDTMKKNRKHNHNALIQVMIPQNINKIVGEFDLVVTDEAHHNVLAEDGNYSRIINMVKPKFQLLLTGTPSKFILENDRQKDGEEDLYHINTVGMDLIGFENFHDVTIDLIKSAYRFTNSDYTNAYNLSEDTKFLFDDTEKTINNVIVGAVRNIALRNGIVLPKNSDFANEGKKLIKQNKFGKTLIMCRNIEQAHQVKNIISKLFDVDVHVSDSKGDVKSVNLTKFKNNEFDFLCVVNRAREGYDDKKIVNLIDITMTHNIDLIYQMFCRIVRKDVDNPNSKLYLKVTPNVGNMPEYTMNIMTAALMLGGTENLSKFNGTNFRNIVMPRVQREDSDDVVIDAFFELLDADDNQIATRRLGNLMLMDLIEMFSKDSENLIHGNERYAMTTLGQSLDVLNFSFDVSSIEECVALGKKYDIKNANQWCSRYKEINEKENLKLPYQPWVIFKLNGGAGEFSKMLKGTLTIEKCVELGKKYGVKTSYGWRLMYKEIGKKENVKLPICPWTAFKLKDRLTFSKMLEPNQKKIFDVSSIEECLELSKKYDIKNTNQWRSRYKEIGEKENLRLPSEPGKIFNFKTDEDNFKISLTHLKVSLIDKCIELGKKYRISSSSHWLKKYKEINEKENLKLPCQPWMSLKLKGGYKEFTALLNEPHEVF
jgi:superfamily II DNA or RNA helicase